MKNLIYMFLMSLLLSCGKSKLTTEEYLSYLSTYDNGLVKLKEVTGYKITVKYLPVDYLVYQDLKAEHNVSVDSLRKLYTGGLTFLLTIEVDGEEESDVMYQDITSIEEYKQRAIQLNFSIADYLKIKTNQGECKPVLVNLENTYSLSKGRNLYIVFSKDDEVIWAQSNDIDLIFEDQLFSTGIHHFVFDKEKIEKVPQLIFDKG